MSGVVAGVVSDVVAHERVGGALVRLSCSCLIVSQIRRSDARGVFRFEGLPPGTYQLYAEAGEGSEIREFELPERAKYQANLGLNVSGEPLVHYSTVPDRAAEPKPLPVSMQPGFQPPPLDVYPDDTALDKSAKRGRGFELERSLFDDAGMQELLGSPRLEHQLL